MLRQLAQVICASSVSRHPLAILRAQWHFPAQHRTLYSFSSMGIDAYLQKCEQTKSYFGERQNQFKGRMRACVDATPSRDTMIFTQDIKNMMHLCERHPKDIDLLLKMLRRFCAQDSGSFTENYHFGPVLMRMLNYYDLDDVAMTVFHDAELSTFFSQNSTLQILLDLLFKRNRHHDVLSVYDAMAMRLREEGKSVRKHIATIAFGSCYKLNTPESFDYALKLSSEQRESQQKLTLRSATFLAALAIEQNRPEIGLELILNIGHRENNAVRNIKALAFARLKRFEDSYQELKTVLLEFNATEIENRQRIFPDVLAEILSIVEQTNLLDPINKFKHLAKLLKEDESVEYNNTLDSMLCSPIVYIPENNEANRMLAGRRTNKPQAAMTQPLIDKSNHSNRPKRNQGYF